LSGPCGGLFARGGLDPYVRDRRRRRTTSIYTTGTRCHTPTPDNCHRFNVDATGFAWLVINQNNTRGRFQGTATVTVDGTTATNVFTVEAIDGDRLNPGSRRPLRPKGLRAGADPSTATPIYQASGSIGKGNAVMIK
jgi:hypothetical protein